MPKVYVDRSANEFSIHCLEKEDIIILRLCLQAFVDSVPESAQGKDKEERDRSVLILKAIAHEQI